MRPAIPRRRTCDGRTDAPIRAFAIAQPLTAASQPSRSFRGSASAIPRAWASFTAALAVRPSSMRERTRLVVLLSVPRKETTRAPRRQRSARLKTGVPSITAPSWRKRRFFRAREGAQRPEGEGHRPLVRGDHVHPAPEGLPHVGDRRLAALRVEGRDLDEDVGRHAGDEGAHVADGGPRCSASRDRPFATSRSARPRSIPRGSMARPWRAVAMPVTRTRAPAASSARA